MLFYRVCHWAVRTFLALLWQIETIGLENVPASGGGVICSNHSSNWDPIVLTTRVSRQLHFMAKAELFENPLLRWFLLRIGMVRVQRGRSDRNAIRDVLAYLAAGDLCGIFPEGRRYQDGELHAFLQGAAYFAIKSGVPLIPTAISGDYRKFRSRIRVRFGEALHPPAQSDLDRATMEQWTNALMQAIRALQEAE